MRAAAGAGMVAAGALLGWLTTTTTATGQDPVLVAAHPLQPGQLLTETDLRTVQTTTPAEVGAIAAAQRNSVVGRPVAYPLPAGSLITTQVLGPAAWPPADKAVVAVAVRPGTSPHLEPGQTVGVVVLPNPTTTANTTTTDTNTTANAGTAEDPARTRPADTAVLGVVTAVEDSGPGQVDGRVVTLLLDRQDAPAIAAAGLGQADRIALMLLTAD